LPEQAASSPASTLLADDPTDHAESARRKPGSRVVLGLPLITRIRPGPPPFDVDPDGSSSKGDAIMSNHQCPKCELRFDRLTELDDHCRNDHPEFKHEYPVRRPLVPETSTQTRTAR